jgi:hypothetical protein
MVTLTERAGALLEQVQSEQGLSAPPRLVQQGASLSLTTSAPDPADDVLYHGEKPVLRVAPDAAAALADCTITTQDTPQGTQLAIVRDRSSDGRAASEDE